MRKKERKQEKKMKAGSEDVEDGTKKMYYQCFIINITI